MADKKSNTVKLIDFNPQLCAEWHPNKNRDLDLQTITKWSNRKVWWKCSKGHEWEATVGSRNRGSGCPYCANKKILVGFNDLETINPTLAKEWHPTKNGLLLPSMVSYRSGKKVWWQCKEGHEWQALISNRQAGKDCPYCSGRNAIKGYNDLMTVKPHLAKEWHPTKNGTLKPEDVSVMSNKQVWWQCKKGHEWKAFISNRSRGNGCLYCANKRVLAGFNDLMTTRPNLAKEWHPTRNGQLTPNDVTYGSYKLIWWQCKEGHEWQARVYKKKGCPYCKRMSKDNHNK